MIVWRRILHSGPGSKTTALPRLRQKKKNQSHHHFFLPLTSGRPIPGGGGGVHSNAGRERSWRKGGGGEGGGSGLGTPTTDTPLPATPSRHGPAGSWRDDRGRGTDCRGPGKELAPESEGRRGLV